MRVTSLALTNFRSFERLEPIALGPISVFVGANNSGKSSILRSLHLLQTGSGPSAPDVRIGSSAAKVELTFDGSIGPPLWGNIVLEKVEIDLRSSDRINGSMGIVVNHGGVSQLPDTEPGHFVIPFLAKRKAVGFNENVNAENTAKVLGNFAFLSSKLSRIDSTGNPAQKVYFDMCSKVLGFAVTKISSASGSLPGTYVTHSETLPITQLGEGVAHVVALLVELAVSEGKLFLLEEPESDLHPQALKALLDLIVESSKKNQFVVSTHSNIVLRHLGAEKDALIYEVKSDAAMLPNISTVNLVENNAEARLGVLRTLGYSFSDFDLWEGWLILEESSAERIIRDYLIPWFVPKLSRIRTMSAGGVHKLEANFEDFNRLVRFTHLHEAYRNKAWIRADGDPAGIEILQRIRSSYATSWDEDRFANFKCANFESYYPTYFQSDIDATLAIKDKQSKRAQKKVLLERVLVWLDSNEAVGKQQLAESAAEIIMDLTKIESQLFQ
jgi:predicted ATPase